MKWEDIAKNYLVDTLQFLKSSSGIAITQGQLYIQEMLAWQFYSSVIWASVFGVCALLLFLPAIYLSRKERIDGDEAAMGITSLMFAVLLTLMSFYQVNCAVKVKVAPRVVLIEKLGDMVNK